jgi:COMPASS component SWD2
VLQDSFRPAKIFRDAVDPKTPYTTESYPSSPPAPPQITSITFDDNGEFCVTAGEDEAFIVWDARKGV